MNTTINGARQGFLPQFSLVSRIMPMAMLMAFFTTLFVIPESAQAELLRGRNANPRENKRFEQSADGERNALRWTGYRQWNWQESTCEDCEIRFISAHPDLLRERPQAFIDALEEIKPEIRELYKPGPGELTPVTDQEYTLLAHMAIGIMGRESKFFESPRYKAKEAMPGVVSIAKRVLGKSTSNSRGPTQIKEVPERIAETYGIVPATLHEPKNAALATMGYLIESLQYLKNTARNHELEFINESNYVDYLPYLYFGGRKKLIERTATPEINIYVNDMKEYMSYVEVYERPRRVQLPQI